MKTTNRTKDTTRVRNIGIIAHVDAGKTTVTERILFYTGVSHTMGNVHHGNTQMDVDPSEVKHGITVNSAATTVDWLDHTINLIDTPGHIDFNIEVKRALRVLDGAVVVFDAVAGVEPQTETNWRLADEFGVPRMCFVNKMDRAGANFVRTCEMIEERLGATPLVVQLPIGNSDRFAGVIDLIRGVALTWADANGTQIDEIPVPVELAVEADAARCVLLEQLAASDDELMARYLDDGDLPVAEITAAVRRLTLSGQAVPVLCGSAFKNKGVQPVLDAVTAFLPSPTDVAPPDGVDGEHLVAFAFKVASAARSQGMLTYCRLYAGELKAGDTVVNASNGKRERVGRIFEMHADSHRERKSATAGDIVALPGLKAVATGDTLCAADSLVELERIEVPEPVTAMAIEPVSREDAEKMGACLAKLARTDPTLRVRTDPETGQTVLAGMGELQLHVAGERLEDLGVQVRFGAPEVSFRETVRKAAEVTYLHKKQTGGPGQRAQLTLVLEPLHRGEGVAFESRVSGGAIPAEFIGAIERGVREAAASGVVEGHEVIDFRAVVTDGVTHANDSSAIAFQTAAGLAFRQAMREAAPVVLEPLMKVDVTVPEEALGDVIGDLGRRRGMVVGQSPRGHSYLVEAEVPLQAMFGYIGDLRSFSHGRGNFSMEFARYAEATR